MKSTRLVVAALFLFSACASAPKIDYYTLDMAPSGQSRSTVHVKIERLQTSEALSRSQILIQSSATRVEYYATDRWAGGIGELVQQKLRAEFGESSGGAYSFILSGVIVSFGQVDTAGGAQADAELRVRIRDASAKRYEDPVIEKTYRATRPLGNANPNAVVSGLSRCLEEIAAEIVSDFNTQ